jgi:MFS family permease
MSIPHEQNRYWVWGVLLAVMLLTAAIRIRLRAVPLERDEGEYAYGGQLILQGLPDDAPLYNIKPAIYITYALIQAVFGQTHSGIHLGLLVVNAATVFVLFFLAKRLFDPATAVAVAAAFAVLSVGRSVQGFSANREHFVILPALAGILLVLRAIRRQTWLSLLTGALLLGISFIMKPNGLFFIAFAGLYLLFCEIKRRPFNWKVFMGKGLVFAFAVVVPFALICLVLWWRGLFRIFCLWTFEYSRQYASAMPISLGLRMLEKRVPYVTGPALLLWIMAGFGLISLLWYKRARDHAIFVVGFVLFSLLAVCPGLYFRPHYFILLLPAAALLAGIGADCIYHFFAKRPSVSTAKLKPVVLVLIVLFHPVYQQRDYFFVMSPAKVSRTTYPGNPFVESLEIASFIKKNSTADDKTAILGSEPQIYFYSHRHAATGHMYTYPLMGKYDFALELQKQMIREIETAKPKFLIFVNLRGSWLATRESERLMTEWFQQYQPKYYRTVAIIEIFLGKEAVYHWGQEAIEYKPRSPRWIAVFQREEYDLYDILNIDQIDFNGQLGF